MKVSGLSCTACLMGFLNCTFWIRTYFYYLGISKWNWSVAIPLYSRCWGCLLSYAAQCISELVKEGNFVHTTELENMVSTCFRALDASNYDVLQCSIHTHRVCCWLQLRPTSQKVRCRRWVALILYCLFKCRVLYVRKNTLYAPYTWAVDSLYPQWERAVKSESHSVYFAFDVRMRWISPVIIGWKHASV